MKSTYKKKKQLPAQRLAGKDLPGDEKHRIVNDLMEMLPSASFEEAVSAYMAANGDPNYAADVLGGLIDKKEDLAECSSSSGSLMDSIWGSGSSEEAEVVESRFRRKNVGGRKAKKVVAATGTISTILEKDYVMCCGRRGDFFKQKGYCKKMLNRGDMEQFLCSMLGNESELSMAVVRDVLCHCKYDVVKSLEALLDFCAPFNEQSKNGCCYSLIAANKEDVDLQTHCNLGFLNVEPDFTSSSESESWDNDSLMAHDYRSYLEVLAGYEGKFVGTPRDSNSNPSQEMLRSLFNVSSFSERKSNTMNWRDIVQKVELMSHGVNFSSTESFHSAEGVEYDMLRRDAKKNWDSMRGCYKRAAMAYSNGDQTSASYHSEQGISYSKKAREADEKASKDIFKARNRCIQNVITIDLHGQNIKQAINLLKLHLLFATYAQSIRSLRVITGCGAPATGKSRLKQAVVELVKREGIEWRNEENPGCVLIKVDGQRELRFLQSEYN